MSDDFFIFSFLCSLHRFVCFIFQEKGMSVENDTNLIDFSRWSIK